MQEDFGRQRKQFMKQMMQLEDELNLSRQTVEKFSSEVQELSTQLLYRDEELKTLQMAAHLTEQSSREAHDMDRTKYNEEIASIRQIISGPSRVELT